VNNPTSRAPLPAGCETGEGEIEIEVADRVDELAIKPDLFLCLAQRGRERTDIGQIIFRPGNAT
jgi:hypothetical protein